MEFLYPLLFVLLHINSLYAKNFYEIKFVNFFVALLASLLFFALLEFFLYKLNLNINLVAFISIFIFFVITNLNILFVAKHTMYQRTLLKNKVIFLSQIFLITVLLSIGIYFVFRNIDLSFISKILYWSALILNLLISIDIFKKMTSKNIVQNDISLDFSETSNFPDIYHIILDAHNGFNISGNGDDYFKNELSKRGFHVYENFYSNYNRTNLSLPSMLNMNYVYNLLGEIKDNIVLPDMILPFYNGSTVFSFFKRTKYLFNLIVPDCFTIILNKVSNVKLNQFFNILFYAFVSLERTQERFNYENRALKPFEYFKALIPSHSQKNFHFLHVLAPHQPYFCNENGELLQTVEMLNVNNYLPYQKHINKLALDTIDNIKSKMKSNSIIIIHGDHGKHFAPENEIFSVLMAIYTPDNKKLNFTKEQASLVNLYRAIFNEYFGANLELLESEFYTTNDTDFKVVKAKKPWEIKL